MRIMGLKGKTSYRYRVRKHGIRTLVIGKASLVRVEDVMRELRS